MSEKYILKIFRQENHLNRKIYPRKKSINTFTSFTSISRVLKINLLYINKRYIHPNNRIYTLIFYLYISYLLILILYHSYDEIYNFWKKTILFKYKSINSFFGFSINN